MTNDLISTICLATVTPIVVVPSMNQHMYLAPAAQYNLNTLLSRGVLIWGPDSGNQVYGDVGLGRILDPFTLVNKIIEHFFFC